MPAAEDYLELPAGVAIPLSGMTFTASRSSGPGGQNVNKVNSKVTLTVPLALLAAHLPGYAMRRLPLVAGSRLAGDPGDRIVIAASDSRSQLANRRVCVARLREVLIAALHRPPVRRKTKPSAGARQRRIDAKKQRGQIKQRRRKPGSED